MFDEGHKKPIPVYPELIGVVTSETGAVLHDVRNVLARRMPSAEIILCPVHVQGAGAADEIADALELLNEDGRVDVILVARGGGSIEDLWSFNEEIVARAIYASRIPVVSAVGHEVDFTIADFVADLRAPTPSAAAELLVRDRREVLEFLGNMCYTARDLVDHRLRAFRERVQSLVTSYAFNRPRDMVRELAQRVDELDRHLSMNVTHLFQLAQRRHQNAHQRLETLAPRNVLKRGYAIVRKDRKVVTSAAALRPGDLTTVELQDGERAARIEKTA